jgi:hypothetical protein
LTENEKDSKSYNSIFSFELNKIKFSNSYKYPNGKHIHIDLSSALRPTESNHICVSEEQYAIYCDVGTSFELCKICSVNNKDSKIQPCGHLICQSCLIAWQVKLYNIHFYSVSKTFLESKQC